MEIPKCPECGQPWLGKWLEELPPDERDKELARRAERWAAAEARFNARVEAARQAAER